MAGNAATHIKDELAVGGIGRVLGNGAWAKRLFSTQFPKNHKPQHCNECQGSEIQFHRLNVLLQRRAELFMATLATLANSWEGGLKAGQISCLTQILVSLIPSPSGSIKAFW